MVMRCRNSLKQLDSLHDRWIADDEVFHSHYPAVLQLLSEPPIGKPLKPPYTVGLITS